MSAKNRRGGLGRGLGALIPTAPISTLGAATATSLPSSVAHPAPVVAPGPGSTVPGSTTVPDAESTSTSSAPVGDALRADDHGSEEPSAQVGDQSLEVGETAPAAADAGEGPLPVPGASFAELPIDSVHPNPRQPRQVFDEDALAELAHSVREFGILQPIVVRPDDQGYELVMGERRLRAATAAGLETIPAIVRSTGDDAMLRDALLENIHRAQLNPLEEAAAYQQLLEEFGVTHDELAQRIGRSRPQVSNTIRLLNLSIPVQRRVAAGVLSAGHARALLGLEDTELQDELAGRIVAEGLSVRATEELVALAVSGHGGKKATRRAATQRITAPAVTDLAEKLSDTLDTRVRVELGRRKGRITVEFASVDDLERIVGVMAPNLATKRSAPDQANEP